MTTNRRGLNRGAVLAAVLSGALVAGWAWATTSSTRPGWPDGWEEMEIEAKWEIDEATYRAMVERLPGLATDLGFRVGVRWRGISRRFTDLYYDDEATRLSRAKHVLRHRTRHRTDPRAPNNELETLRSLPESSWRHDWQKVQYKSTPSRILAVWYRNEAGAERVCSGQSDTGPSCEDRVASVLGGEQAAHSITSFLQSEHPDYDFATSQPFLKVVDYRYRIQFCSISACNDDNVEFEVSLDRVFTTDLATGATVFSVEAELELVKFDPQVTDVARLFDLVRHFESEFELAPSTRSKGGLEVALTPTFVVTTDDDRATGTCSEDCSLREAVIESNRQPGPDIVRLTDNDYQLEIAGDLEDACQTGDLDLTDHITLLGVGAERTVIDADKIDRAIHVLGEVVAEINGLTLTGGEVHGDGRAGFGGGLLSEADGEVTIRQSSVVDNVASAGGGLANLGLMLIDRSTVANNLARTDSTAGGGGVISSGDLTVHRTAVVKNEAKGPSGEGGGVRATGGTVAVANSTVARNKASASGGGITNDGAAIVIVDSTVARNRAGTSAGGLFIAGGGLNTKLQNSILARNEAPDGPDCAGSVESLGHNLIENTQRCEISLTATDLAGRNPRLGPLVVETAPGRSHLAARPGSPVIDAGDDDTCASEDQLGQDRADGDNDGVIVCDIGAIEFFGCRCDAPGAILGTDQADTLKGSVRPDVICGFGGDDILLGRGGDDCLLGGDGDDSLQGDSGDDTLMGEDGIDFLFGGLGNDTLYGGAGTDILVGMRGADTLSGGTGTDLVKGGRGDDVIEGDDGADLLWGNRGNDVLRGGSGADLILGGSDGDLLEGEEGDDLLVGGRGSDRCIGGVGKDTFKRCEDTEDED